MHQTRPVLLRDRTTLRLGGPARRLVEATDTAEVLDAVTARDAEGEPVLILGGGSNLVVADSGFDGTAVAVATTGVDAEVDGCGGAFVRVVAGESWDEFVVRALAEGWIGIEALSGIPGRVGAVPIQNVGAYGQEVADSVARVEVYDRADRSRRTMAAADCGFGYRTSVFKKQPDQFVVLAVTFQLRLGTLGAPIRYAELARTLGVEIGDRAPAAEVRDAVVALRRSKGMVLDESDHDTWSAGSFFTNPVLPASDAKHLPDNAPRWPQPEGQVKTSAAWLIEQSGFSKGYGNALVSLSTKHTLALTNRGSAQTADLLALAREICDGVQTRFGIRLVNEPVLVGCTL